MICPFCEHPDHRVVESRVADAKDAIRRRRECGACGRRFTTYEHIEEAPIVVIKASGEREPFDRQKLLSGMQRACHKRQVSTQLLEMAVRDIESELRNRLRLEASSQLIGELTLRRLKEIDQVAYVRFASVYRAFSDVEEFEEELARLEREPPLPRGQASLDEHMFATMARPPAGEGRRDGRRLRALSGGLAPTPTPTVTAPAPSSPSSTMTTTTAAPDQEDTD